MHESLWRRVEAALDARSSPFDDPALAAELHADPPSEAAVRRLMVRLERVAAPQPLGARRSRSLVLAAALLLGPGLAFWLWAAAGRSGAAVLPTHTARLSIVVERSSPPPPLGTRVELRPRRVLAWTLAGEGP
jgi:hypothetical protein